jgi:inositol phosphorylceramide mannosyltransferase catalytic subunit
MKKLLGSLSLLLHICASLCANNEVASVSFDESMRKCYSIFDELKTHRNPNWRLCRDLYKAYKSKQIQTQDPYIIPKKIHLIWLGSPLPERCQKIVDSWIKFHPDWEVKVWTDADVEPFGMRNKIAFDCSINWGEKSDIWRYEILHRFGGLYIDTDFECVKAFDLIHKSAEFYAGICYESIALLGNSLIGSVPNHPILTKCIEEIRIGPGDFNATRIQQETGPYHFTRCFMDLAGQFPGKVVSFPTSYFFPLPPTNRVENGEVEEIKSRWLKPESFAIHYWAVSWCKR